ncbi:transcriptional regulator [Desulfonema ishimotonii]|uniref:Transcriptional regulator n=1 Tax=Desulfonema ishimotonii TaxID=45657 RepID=A0A401FYV5_9BACT|nr:Crp/Fnr family transcriptional regulator [Desulfonema ishimotonii]GBC62158.1 transcriptional regulator [Desulfonema ishimotonii]
MEKNSEIIAGIPFFSDLTEAQLTAVLRIMTERTYNRGELIFSDGDPGDGFYAVARGKVKIFKMSSEGKEQILHIFGPGEPFGEVPVFSGRSFPANAQAIAKSRLLFFPRKDFIRLITETPALALNMLAVLSMRLRQFTVQIENLSLKEVPERLAAYLIYLAGEQETDTVTLPISKGQLASLLGTIPETLSRIFAKMSGDGLIAVTGKTICLLNRDHLACIAEYGKACEL